MYSQKIHIHIKLEGRYMEQLIFYDKLFQTQRTLSNLKPLLKFNFQNPAKENDE
jgi:hypothetical protein